jgi:hypothetical protein
MKLTLRQQLTQFGHVLQSALFPALEEQLGELGGPAKRLIATLEMIPLARFIPSARGWIGRPSKDRLAIASAFVAKAVYGFGLTRQLLDALQRDAQLRRICGWETARQIPSEATFSRAFAEFAQMELGQFVHAALIRETQQDRLIGHIARDSTAIEARERFPKTASPATPEEAAASATPAAPAPEEAAASATPAAPATAAAPEPPRKRGPKKGKRGPHKRHKGGKPKPTLPEGTRLHRQRSMSLPDMLKELPLDCSLGVKTSSKGYTQYWRGYKLHLDVADGQIPISAVLTAAKLHDSQVAIPLMTMTSQRVTYCYDLMDSAYDAGHILDNSRQLGHVPIVDPVQHYQGPESFVPPKKPNRQLSWAEEERYKERTMVERVNARLKDEFGGRTVRVRGAAKVMAHLMFGVLALTVDQIRKLIE